MEKLTKNLTMTFAGAAMVLGLTFSACKKEPAPAPTPTPTKTKTELLTASAWKLTAATVDPAISVNGTSITNWYAQMDACSKDNLYTYKTNGQVVYDEGASKCDSNAPQTTTGTWSFNSTETIITQTDASGSESLNVVELTSSALKYTYSETDNGITYTFTFTLSH